MLLFAALFASTVLAAGPSHNVYAVGMSEKMGPFGIFSGSRVIERGSEELHLVIGAFPVPIIGGMGAGWRHNFGEARAVPFTNLTASAIYTLPAMCTANCGIDIRPYVTGSAGIDVKLAEAQTMDFHLMVGVMSMFSVFEGAIFESPSDRPAIWPVLNLSLVTDGTEGATP
jgi:hypothetical protein